MATRNKRVQVALSDETARLVDELHAISGQSKSSIISELLDQVVPALQMTIQALRLLEDRPREAQRLLNNYTHAAIAQVTQANLDLDASIDRRTVKGKRAKKGGLRGGSTN